MRHAALHAHIQQSIWQQVFIKKLEYDAEIIVSNIDIVKVPITTIRNTDYWPLARDVASID